MDFYTILELDSHADAEAIRAAYRLLARRYHPDAGDGSSSDKFRQITEAYETLSDPQRRATYDRSLAPHIEPRPTPVRVPVEPLSPGPPPYGSPFAEWDFLFEQWTRRRFFR
jgi:curved DNA-binding protein CbpA